jgi:hypothetical protein
VTELLGSISAGDEVAILPSADAPPEAALEIVRVTFVNVHLIRLVDQRIYSIAEGRGLTATSRGFIVPATESHRRAIGDSRAASDDAGS